MTTRIRIAKLEDADQIAALVRMLGYETPSVVIAGKLQLFEDSRFDEVFVATNDNQLLVGCISVHAHELFHADGRLGRITSLVVHKDYTRKGLGTALLAAAESFFKACDCIRIEVTSGDRRLGAHLFYLANGFREDQRRFLKTF